jgi:hypothetical protein
MVHELTPFDTKNGRNISPRISVFGSITPEKETSAKRRVSRL